jgi:hypothetical protein
MGATTFYNKIYVKEKTRENAKKAFIELRDVALHYHGHGGYSGSIAEKDGFTMSRKPKDIPVGTWVEMVHDFDEEDTSQEHYYDLKSDYKIYDDKWGPALCIETNKGFVFCGWASC